MKNVLITNPDKFKKELLAFQKDGVEKIHILADFDKTLTKGAAQGKRQPAIIAQIRNCGYLGQDYSVKAHSLFEKYHPLERDPKLDKIVKASKMREWWVEHFKLLVEHKLTKQMLDQIVRRRSLKFRRDSLKFLALAKKLEIPLIIMSAAPGDMIVGYLKQEKCLFKNIHIIANFLNFDKCGIFLNCREPIIHPLNKHEIELKKNPIYQTLKRKRNILLLGDSLDDVNMVKGFPFQHLLKIGFLNSDIEKNLPHYQKKFDVVILNDAPMTFLVKLLKKISA